MRTVIIICFTLFLTACSWFTPYQPDKQQGNIITPKMLKQLHPGMSPQQVRQTMGGTPVLRNVFAENTMTYVYTFQPSKNKMQTKKVVLTFKNDKLVTIKK